MHHAKMTSTNFHFRLQNAMPKVKMNLTFHYPKCNFIERKLILALLKFSYMILA